MATDRALLRTHLGQMEPPRYGNFVQQDSAGLIGAARATAYVTCTPGSGEVSATYISEPGRNAVRDRAPGPTTGYLACTDRPGSLNARGPRRGT
jgi:hypothetical protein